MPATGAPAASRTRVKAGGSAFGSAASAYRFAGIPGPGETTHSPASVKVYRRRPAGVTGATGTPPAVRASTSHSPTRSGGSFRGGSFGPGAATARASQTTASGLISGSPEEATTHPTGPARGQESEPIRAA